MSRNGEIPDTVTGFFLTNAMRFQPSPPEHYHTGSP